MYSACDVPSHHMLAWCHGLYIDVTPIPMSSLVELLGSDWIVDVWYSSVDCLTDECMAKCGIGRWNLVVGGESLGA